MHTPFGEGRCIATIDYGPEEDLLWVCIQQEEPHVGALWTWHNSEVRVMANRSFLRGSPTERGCADSANTAQEDIEHLKQRLRCTEIALRNTQSMLDDERDK
jgi:hypothetical protein